MSVINPNTLPIPYSTVEQIVDQRNRDLHEWNAAYDVIDEVAKRSALSRPYDLADAEQARRTLDSDAWRKLIKLAGIDLIMDATAKAAFQRDLLDNPPEVTLKAVYDTLTFYTANAQQVVERGIVKLFDSLSDTYKANDRFKLPHIMRFDHGWQSGWSHWSYYSGITTADLIDDLHRILLLLDGQVPPDQDQYGTRFTALAQHHFRLHASENTYTDKYLRLTVYKAGSVKVQVLDKDLLDKINIIIARHHERELPDNRNNTVRPQHRAPGART